MTRTATRAVATVEGEQPLPINVEHITTFLRHDQIAPSALNPRKEFGDEELDLLRQSILTDGLLQNLVVRDEPLDGKYTLVAGERRWRAIAIAISDGDWPEDRTIPCRLIPAINDQRHAVLALIENLNRQDLSYLEQARAFHELVTAHGFSTADIAERIGMTQRVVQQRIQLLALSPTEQTRLAEGKINIEQARNIIANKPPAIELPDDQLLILLEFADYTSREASGEEWQDLQVDCRMPSLDGSPLAGWIHCGAAHENGATQARLSYNVRRQIIHQFCVGGDAGDKLERGSLTPALTDVRARLGLGARKGYHTAWLNKPFKIDPDKAAAAAQRKAAAETNQAKFHAEEKARLERRASQAKAHSDLLELVRSRSVGVYLDDGTALPIAAEIMPTLIEASGAPIPWKLIESKPGAYQPAHLVDANGHEIMIHGAVSYLAILMASVNGSAGQLAIIEPESEDDAAADDEDDDDDDDDDNNNADDDEIGQIDPSDDDPGETAGDFIHALHTAGDAAMLRLPTEEPAEGPPATAVAALSYDRAVDVLQAVEKWPGNGLTGLQSAIGGAPQMTTSAIGRRLDGLATAGLIDQARSPRITAAGIEALLALGKTPIGDKAEPATAAE